MDHHTTQHIHILQVLADPNNLYLYLCKQTIQLLKEEIQELSNIFSSIGDPDPILLGGPAFTVAFPNSWIPFLQFR